MWGPAGRSYQALIIIHHQLFFVKFFSPAAPKIHCFFCNKYTADLPTVAAVRLDQHPARPPLQFPAFWHPSVLLLTPEEIQMKVMRKHRKLFPRINELQMGPA
jgi:hypothetical protein